MIMVRTLVIGIILLHSAIVAVELAPPPLSLPRPVGSETLQVAPRLPLKPWLRPPSVYPWRWAKAKVRATYIPINSFDDLFGSRENYGVVVAPDQVELMRLRPVKGDGKVPVDYQEEGQMSLPLEDAVALCVMLTNDDTYDWAHDHLFDPVYAFRLKFRQDEKTVSVDLSFTNATLRVQSRGHSIAEKNFDYGFEAMLQVVERHFPGTMADLAGEKLPPSYEARRAVPLTEAEILTADKAENLIAAADEVLITSESRGESVNRSVYDRDWILRVSKAVGQSQISRKTHCFCIGWGEVVFFRQKKILISIAAIHGNQLRISSDIAAGDYPINEARWKVISAVLDEQTLVSPAAGRTGP